MAKGKNVTNYKSNVVLTGTAYADTIHNDGGNNVSINAGKGNDIVSIASGTQNSTVDGGEVAFRKIRDLLSAGANVKVIAPEICAGVEELFQRGKISLLRNCQKKTTYNMQERK